VKTDLDTYRSKHVKKEGNKPPKTTRTYLTSKELKISQAAFSGEDIAVPTVAMCVLFQVLLSTITVRLAIAVV
jgi:hypothetical protein